LKKEIKMKLCKDCDYSTGSSTFAKCRHELAKREDPVNGAIKFCHCSTMRNPYGECNVDAILFKEKASISEKLKAKAEQLFGKYWS
jgi:hypothetical protein